jgi:dienelactone hydrolase
MKTSLLRKPLACASIAALSLSAMSAFAAPTQGPAGMAFYTPPTPLPAGSHGDLIWYRTATATLPGSPAFNAWNVMYLSTDAVDAKNAVTGTVFVPKAAYTGSGQRPIITYAVGTHGLNQSCAPSLQFQAGTDYETANINAALNQGYAVLVTDNPGYTNGDTPTYLAGAAQGHAALDIVKASTQIPSSPFSASAKVGIWGFSQGGQTSAFAGQQLSTYAPTMSVVGVASGGTPGDFINSAYYLNGSTGMSFLIEAVDGLSTQYPTGIPLNSLLNANGQAAITQAESQCVFDSLFTFMNHNVTEYTTNAQTLDQLLTITSVDQTLLAQNLGGTKIPVPLYLYHGVADEFIPLEQSETLKKQYCALGTNVTYGVYPSEHIATQFQAAPTVLSWLGDRFAGVTANGTCSTTAKAPVSTANPGGGDYVVTLDKWPLAASIHLATLDQDVILPDTSTFSAEANMTSTVLSGDLAVPTFSTHLRILGLPLTVKLSVTESSPASGTSSIDKVGELHLHGHAYANLTIDSAGIAIFRIPFKCTTESPIDFPLDLDAPVSALGNGQLTFPGTTTFPPISSQGCVFNGLFTVLMSGPGQTYSYNVSPPAPTTW